jgi:hypothetical protein
MSVRPVFKDERAGFHHAARDAPHSLVFDRRLFPGGRPLGRLINDFQNLLNDLRMQNRTAMERDGDPELLFAVNPMATLRPKVFERGEQRRFSASAAIHRGSLGIHFNGRGEPCTQSSVAFSTGIVHARQATRRGGCNLQAAGGRWRSRSLQRSPCPELSILKKSQEVVEKAR